MKQKQPSKGPLTNEDKALQHLLKARMQSSELGKACEALHVKIADSPKLTPASYPHVELGNIVESLKRLREVIYEIDTQWARKVSAIKPSH
jgi:hypothetical protein